MALPLKVEIMIIKQTVLHDYFKSYRSATSNCLSAPEYVLKKKKESGNFFLSVIWHNREISKSSLYYLSVYISAQLFMMMIIGNKMAEISQTCHFFIIIIYQESLLPEGVYRCNFRLVVKKIFSLRVVVSSSQDKRKEWCRRSGWRWGGGINEGAAPPYVPLPPQKAGSVMCTKICSRFSDLINSAQLWRNASSRQILYVIRER